MLTSNCGESAIFKPVELDNPDFSGLEFEIFRKQAGLNSFSLTPRKWIESNNIKRLQ